MYISQHAFKNNEAPLSAFRRCSKLGNKNLEKKLPSTPLAVPQNQAMYFIGWNGKLTSVWECFSKAYSSGLCPGNL